MEDYQSFVIGNLILKNMILSLILSPKPKVDSSLLIFHPKKNFVKIDDPINLEKITRIFFNQRRKC